MYQKIKSKIFSWLGLVDKPVVKVYRGFGNYDEFFLTGHVLGLSPRPRKTFTKNIFRNIFSVIRLFMVRPVPDVAVTLEWKGGLFETVTENDGFFKFHIVSRGNEAGMCEVKVSLKKDPEVHGFGSVFFPPGVHTGFISDVDDTFLISHTGNTRRRLRELFTHNERNRRAFEGVVNHYQLLSMSGRAPGEPPNPFFYVSSSEWNLYDFIREFAVFNKLPAGVFLLGQLKRIRDFLQSGQNNHATKLNRIQRIINTYPALEFVLLGDDSQQDPFIYRDATELFPDRIFCVYIRNVGQRKSEVEKILGQIEAKGISCCYFKHSSEAMIHSKKIGLILD